MCGGYPTRTSPTRDSSVVSSHRTPFPSFSDAAASLAARLTTSPARAYSDLLGVSCRWEIGKLWNHPKYRAPRKNGVAVGVVHSIAPRSTIRSFSYLNIVEPTEASQKERTGFEDMESGGSFP